ncbi:MAG TPA: hypothetical protein VFU21_29065 [Kofleriaceae bacterium]|nr:hypothetical protein [Kofleriaceae bacterium]
MSASPERTLLLRPALLRPVRRRDLAIATAVLLSSAAGGALVALLQPPRPRAPAQVTTIALPVPVPTAVAPAAAPVALPFDLAPVIEDGGLRVVVQTAVEPQWLGSDIAVSDHGGVRVVERSLSAGGAARFSRLVGARLRLFGPGSCVAEVTGVSALGRFAPDDLGEADAPVDSKAAWQAADGSHLIAGALAPIAGDCTGALWAQPEALAAPVVARVEDAGADQARRATDLLRAEPDFADRTGGAPVTFEVDAIALDGGETVLVASALVEGCADFEPVLSALYAVQADGALHPVGSGMTIGSIAAAADVDGDGHAEILVRGDALDSSILRRRAAGYQEEAHVAVPIYGCRC